MKIALVMLAAVLTLSGCDLMGRISEGAYRNAVTDGTIYELRQRNIPLKARPACAWLREGPPGTVKISCTATTKGGEPVRVEGVTTDADSENPREQYTILVAGRPVLHQDCLGLGCGERS